MPLEAMPAIKRCPHCDSVEVSAETTSAGAQIMCQECYLSGPIVDSVTSAIEVWNSIVIMRELCRE